MTLKFEKAGDGPDAEINLSCGPEPDNLNEDAVRVAAMVLLSSQHGTVVPGVRLAQKTGAWFYWRYAVQQATIDLVQQVGEDDAWEILHGIGDRSFWHALRAKTFADLMTERFGFDLTGGGSELLPGLKERIPEEYFLTFGERYVDLDTARDALLSIILREMEQFAPAGSVIVLASTNRAEDLDPEIRAMLDRTRP